MVIWVLWGLYYITIVFGQRSETGWLCANCWLEWTGFRISKIVLRTGSYMWLNFHLRKLVKGGWFLRWSVVTRFISKVMLLDSVEEMVWELTGTLFWLKLCWLLSLIPSLSSTTRILPHLHIVLNWIWVVGCFMITVMYFKASSFVEHIRIHVHCSQVFYK